MVLLVDFQTGLSPSQWPDYHRPLPASLPCLGLFAATQETLALEWLEQQLLHDYLLNNSLSVSQLRRALYHAQQHAWSAPLSQVAQSDPDQTGVPQFAGELESELLKSVLNIFPQPLLIKNRRHEWVACNQAFSELIHMPVNPSLEELRGKSDFDFCTPEEARQFWDEDDHVFRTGAAIDSEDKYTDPQGVKHTLLIRKRLFRDGQGKKFLIASMANIDALKRQEQEIQTLRHRLEERVQERTVALEASNRELQHEIEVRKRAEYRARQSQERLLAITRAMPDPILVLDAAGTILAAYASDEKLLYQPKAAILQRNIFAILPPVFHEDIRYALNKTLSTGQQHSYEYLMPVPAGERWFEARSSRVESQDSDQAPQLILAIRDITTRKEFQQALSASEQKFKAVFNQTIQLMGVLDTEGRILDINRVALEMIGMEIQQLRGHPFWESPWWQHSPPLQTQVQEAIQRAAHGQTARFEATHIDRMGQTHIVDFSLSPLTTPEGEVRYLIPTGHDITPLKQALEALASSEAQFSKAFEYAPIGKALISRQGRFFRVNRTFCDIFGYTPGELIGKKFKDLTHPDEIQEDVSHLRKLIAREIEIYTREKRYVHKDGRLIWGKLSLVFIADSDDKPLFLIAQVEDITRQKQALAELEQSEERFKALTTSLEDIIYTLDAELRCTSIYGYWHQSFTAQPEMLLGRQIKEMPFVSVDFHVAPHEQALAGQPTAYEWQVPFPEGLLYFQSKLTPLKNEAGEIKGVAGSIRNITQMKRAEAQIKASLQEKELLLREIYHRVKNNLQIISSMLNLQARQSQNSETVALLKETQNRVLSMALVHEKLYESPGLAQLNFAAYIQELCSHLVNVYALQRSRIRLHFDCENIHLNADIAISCGLILNEVISNTLKHAFPEQGLPPDFKPEIQITLKQNAAAQCLLRIKDNGIGLPEDLDFNTLTSLGLRLVKRLSHQIEGELKICRDQGTCLEIDFPLRLESETEAELGQE